MLPELAQETKKVLPELAQEVKNVLPELAQETKKTLPEPAQESKKALSEVTQEMKKQAGAELDQQKKFEKNVGKKSIIFHKGGVRYPFAENIAKIINLIFEPFPKRVNTLTRVKW